MAPLRALCAAGWLLSALPAAAAEAPAAEKAPVSQAKSLYEQGKRQYNLGNYAEALALFEKAYDVQPVHRLLFNIAQCHRGIGSLEKARRVYSAFLRESPQDEPNREAAQQHLDEVDAALAKQPVAKAGAEALVPPPAPVVPLAVPKPAAPPVKIAPRAAKAVPASFERPDPALQAELGSARTLSVVEIASRLEEVDELRRGKFRGLHFGAVLRNTAAEVTPWLSVLAREEVEARRQELIRAGKAADANPLALARAIGTDLVLLAEVTSVDETLTLDVQLVDARTGLGRVVKGETVRVGTQAEVDRELPPVTGRLLSVIPRRGYLSRGLVGAGVVAGAAGVFFGLKQRSAVSDWKAASGQASGQWTDAAASVKSNTQLANAGFIVGGVLLAVGVGLLAGTQYW